MNRTVFLLVAVSLALLPSVQAGADEWQKPPKELLTEEGLRKVAGKDRDTATTLEAAFVHAWQLAVERHNQGFLFYRSDGENLKRSAAFLKEHRPEAVWALLFLAQADLNGLREQYVKAMDDFLDESCVGILKRAVSMKGGPVGFAAIPLAKMRPKESLDLLIAAADKCPARSLPDLVCAIGRTGDPKAGPFLRKTAIEAGADARQRAQDALEHYVDQETFLVLKKALKLDRHNDRGILNALCRQQPGDELNRILRKEMEDYSLPTETKELMASAIARKGPDSIKKLVEEMIDGEWGTADAAKETLLKMAPQAVPFVLPLAEDPVVEVRTNALFILAASGDPRALPPLEKALESLLPHVRLSTTRVIGSITSEDLQEKVFVLLKKAAGDSCPNVRQAAEEALRRLAPAKSP